MRPQFCALAMVALCADLQAACSTSTPASNATVTCNATAPNPDTTGIQGGAGVNNVTVQVTPATAQIETTGTTAVSALGTGWNIVNAGRINRVTLGANGPTIHLVNGGEVNNGAGATIGGNQVGIRYDGGVARLVNDGEIAIIATGVQVSNTTAEIVNRGTISAQSFSALLLQGGGTVDNQAGGSLTGTGNDGITVSGGPGMVTNAGTINGAGGGIEMTAGGQVVNAAGGMISGMGNGVLLTGGNVRLDNAGTITDTTAGTGSAIAFGGGDDLLVLATGSVVNSDVNTGAGDDLLRLTGTGTEDGPFTQLERLRMEGSDWTLSGGISVTEALVQSGVLRTGVNNIFTNAVRLQLDPGTTFDLADRVQAIGLLTGNGAVTLGSGRLVIAQVDNATFSGPISGSGGLTLQGAFTLQLASSNSYTGSTLINSGTLLTSASGFVGPATVNGRLEWELAAAGSYNGTLSGSGIIRKRGATLTLGGTSAAFAGTTTVESGDLVLQGRLEGTLEMLQGSGQLRTAAGLEVGALRIGTATANPGNPQLQVAGATIGILLADNLDLRPAGVLQIGLDGSSNDRIVVSAAGGVQLGGSLALSGNVTGLPFGTPLVLVEQAGAGAVVGTFAGLPEGATVSVGGVDLVLSYAGGNGNDITLQRAAGAEAVLTIGPATVLEGNTGTPVLQFTVTATPPPAVATTVAYATSNGSATAGSDYTATSGTLNFASGASSATITVPVTPDLTVEANETLTVTLSNPGQGATLGDPATATGTIDNDDSAVISISNPSVAEGNAGSTPLPFVLALSQPVQGVVGLDFVTADGNAADPLLNATTADGDYVATAGNLSFPSDSTTPQTVNVPVNGDSEVEPDQGLRLLLSNLQLPPGIPAGAVTLATPAGAGTIANDDGAALGVTAVAVAEGNAGSATLAFTVTLSNPAKTPVTVQYATSDGTATAGSDYTAASATLNFAPGNQSQVVNVSVAGDVVVEGNETLLLTLSNPSGATLGTAMATGTINNDDSATLSINSPAGQPEGNAGNTPLNFTATLSNPVQGTVSASVNSADGNNANPLLNATVADNDYVAVVNGTLSIASGTTATTAVQVVGDTDVEPGQSFRLILSNLQLPAGIPAGAVTLGTATGTGTILNDDGTVLSIANASVAEGNAGTSTLTFTVSLSNPNKEPVTVQYATGGGTATAGSDYLAASGTLTFPGNVQSQTFAVTVNGDSVLEADETFGVTLSNPSGATLGAASATGTILNDDAVSLAVADASALEGSLNNNPGRLVFVVTLSGSSALPVTVAYTTSNGTATAGSDYTAASGTLSFAPGVNSQSVTVLLAPDQQPEPPETLILTLSNPSPAAPQVVLADATATGTIINDDFVTQIPVNDGRALLALLLLVGLLGTLATRRR